MQEEDDIDEEEEMLLAQAVNLTGEDSMEDLMAAESFVPNPAPFTPMQGHPVMMMPTGRQPLQTVPPMQPMTPMLQPLATSSMPMTPMPLPMTPVGQPMPSQPSQTHSRRIPTTPKKGQRNQGPGPGHTVIPKKSLKASGSGTLPTQPDDISAASSAAVGPSPSPAQQGPKKQRTDLGMGTPKAYEAEQVKAENAQVEPRYSSTWSKCVMIDTLKLSEPTSECFNPPGTLKKAQQKSKWAAEVGKLVAWVPMLEKSLSNEQVKVTEHELKSAVTQVKKILARKLDKRMEYEKRNNKGETLLSERVEAFIGAFESVKDLRSLAVNCTKAPSTFRGDNFKELMEKFQNNLKIVSGGNCVGIPLHWMQARHLELK